MELDTLNITREEAEAKVAEYSAAVAQERTREDEAILMGYRAAARGLPLIRLSQAIRSGGFFPNGLPRLAVINANAKEVSAHWDDQDVIFTDDLVDAMWGRPNRGALVNSHSVRVRDVRPANTRWSSGWSMVPLIPPNHRPRRNRLHRRHILWEVEEWKRGVSPRDPALLRHIRGDLWSVLAVWDLTELERYALSQR